MVRIRSLHMSACAPKLTLEKCLPEVARVRDKVLDLLRTPSPALVDLNIDFPYAFTPGVEPDPDEIASYWHGGPSETTPLFLPVAPNLRTMHVGFVPVVFRRAHSDLPSLERISIEEGPIYEAHVIDLLAAAPNVQQLTLDIGQAQQTPHLPLARTTLRRLSKVEFGDYYSFGLLENGAELLPTVSDLQLCALDDLRVNASGNLARNLRRLHISYQEGLDDYVDALRPLSNIAAAEFWQGSMQDDVFFAPLLDADAPMWPRLEALILRQTVTRSRDRDGLRLVQARNGARANASMPLLKKVVYDNVSVPSWIDVEIRAVLLASREPEES